MERYDLCLARKYSGNELVDLRRPNKIRTTKLSTSPKLWRAWRSPRRTTRLMVPLTCICCFEAYFRRSLMAGRICFLHNGRRDDRWTRLEPASVPNVKTTGWMEESCTLPLSQALYLHFWNKAKMASSSLNMSRSVVSADKCVGVSLQMSTDYSFWTATTSSNDVFG